MSELNAELDELRRRVEEQSQRIEELQDALHTLRLIHRGVWGVLLVIVCC